MQSTSINVNKQTVKQFLEYGAQCPFIFPEYQRPYSWGIDQTDQLFEDLWDFSQREGGTERNGTYFLGCFVFYTSNNNYEIVDGQQRMTTLTLLLRALYTSLDSAVQSREIVHKKRQIGPTIWKEDKVYGELDFSKPLIESRAVDDRYNDIFHNILKTGIADVNAKDNYSKNYIHLQNRIKEKSQDGLGMPMVDFCEAVLNQCVVLPIQTDSQETAQNIFNTLNARGLALSDADIFKALIYGRLADSDSKTAFIEKWKQLSEQANDIGLTMQNLLSYYMFYLRAKRRDTSSTIVALRTFYQDKRYDDLYANDLLDRLNDVLVFLRLVIRRDNIEGEEWSNDLGILRALDVLRFYPNDYWKYPVLTYYLTYNRESDFTSNFLAFLQHLTGELVKRFCVFPTLSAVKGLVLSLNVAILDSAKPSIDFGIKLDDVKLNMGLKQPSRGVRNMLLAIIAYTKQDTLLPQYWEVEHIFPQSWKGDYAQRPEYQLVRQHIDDIGNYLPLEKKLNIRASDGYFASKKPKYEESSIVWVKEVATTPKQDWKVEDIVERSLVLANKIKATIAAWGCD